MKKIEESTFHLWNPFTAMRPFLKYPLVIEKAEGPYLYDFRGRKYFDMSSSMWNVCLGHNRQELIEVIQQQYQRLDFSSPFRAANTVAVELADKLAALCPGDLDLAFLTCNGSDSVESGIKLARQYFNLKKSRKYKVISLAHAYHGVSYGALCCSGFDEDKEPFGPLPPGFIQVPEPNCYRCPYGQEYPACALRCAAGLEEVIRREDPETIALFILEPVMGMGGVVVPPAGYLKRVSALCHQYNILFMTDEVTTGFGRTGKMFAGEHDELTPDLMALGKAMSNGYFPIGATMISRRIWDVFLADPMARFNHGSTYFGHPVGCAAALKTIEILEREKLLDRVVTLGAFFKSRLDELRSYPLVGDIRSKGMMFAIEFVSDKEKKLPLEPERMQKLIMTCYTQGLWAHFAGNTMLIFPPFCVETDLLELVYQTLVRSLKSVERR